MRSLAFASRGPSSTVNTAAIKKIQNFAPFLSISRDIHWDHENYNRFPRSHGVAICMAAHSTAQQTSFVRGSMEEREEGKMQVWYDPIVEGAVAENSFMTTPIAQGYDKLAR